MTPSTLAGGLLAGLLLASAVGRAPAQSAMAAPAQSAVAAEIGVIETVDPASGRRLLHVLEGLGHAEVRTVQRELARAGFEVRWRAGELDAFTRGALQRFQTRRGLAVCACVTIETLIELGIRTRIVQTIVLAAAPLPEAAPGSRAGGTPQETAPGYVEYASSNTLRHYRFDGLEKRGGRAACTVGALRKLGEGVDTKPVSLAGIAPTGYAAGKVVTSQDVLGALQRPGM